MSDFKVAWSNETLEIFRALRDEVMENGFTNVSLNMFVCLIIRQTNILDDCFREFHISKDDVNSIIPRHMQIHCAKVKTRIKVKPSDSDKNCSYALKTSDVCQQFHLQLFSAQDIYGKAISFYVNSALADILHNTVSYAQEFQIDFICPHHFILTMFDEDCRELMNIFADLGVSYNKAKDYFRRQHNRDIFTIPEELSGILSFLNNNVDMSKPCEIIGRDEECNSVWNVMLKKDSRHVLIVGEPGYGKTSLVEKLTYDITCGRSPKQLWGFDVISVNVNALILEIANRPEHFHMILDFLKNTSHAIVFIDNIQELTTIQKAGSIDVLTPLSPLFSFDNVIVVGALNSKAYNEQFIQYDISSQFEIVELLPVLLDDMYSMLRLKIQSLSDYHGVSISPEVARFALKMAFNLFSSEKTGFHPLMNLIDVSLSTAKLMGISVVTRSEILQNCHLYYYMWNNTPLDERRHYAIHEAGHYIVVTECSNILNLKGCAISIIPFGEFNGMTFASLNTLTNAPYNEEYYIDYMAFILAGKAAEEIFDIEPNNGALGDLSRATVEAFDTIQSLDLLGISHRNALYINSTESLPLSDESAELMNEKATELINRATARAKYILEANKDVIEAIANALLETPVMIDDDIDKIWQETISKRPKTSENAAENNGKTC